MRLPRDLSGEALVKALQKLGYERVRQSGSHIRLTRAGDPEHHLTVPAHAGLRLGTISSILADVGEHLGMTRDELLKTLFD